MALFDTHVIVDWSARSKPSPASPSKDAIFWCTVSDGAVQPAAYARTRAEARNRLAALIRTERAQGRRVLLGFDFPFGYPAGVAETLTGQPSALALWEWLADRVQDADDNANNRFAVASEINRHYPGLGPAWGRPASWLFPDVPTHAKVRHGDHPPERRLADTRAKGAKTVWQLAYSGSVGSQVLLGLPTLHALRRDTGAAVWPFDTGLSTPDHPLVFAEVYPSLMQREAHADRAEKEPLDAAQVRVNARALAALDADGALAPLFTADLTDSERRTVEREEAWILGLGHEDRLRGPHDASKFWSSSRERHSIQGRRSASSVGKERRMRPYLKDPAAIYAESFATVRREARLDRFPPDLQPLAIRIIHACGMVEVADRLAFSADLGAQARQALAGGAPILCDCEMVAAGIIRRNLPAGCQVITTLNDPATPALAARLDTTRSAAAVDLWQPHLEGAVVAIGNAPTALFHLLERLDQGWPKPAAILGFPVGFVGAAESKAELAANPRGCAFVTLRGRRGGSAMASAAVNALAAGLPEEIL